MAGFQEPRRTNYAIVKQSIADVKTLLANEPDLLVQFEGFLEMSRKAYLQAYGDQCKC
jgi:hypothetical protein